MANPLDDLTQSEPDYSGRLVVYPSDVNPPAVPNGVPVQNRLTQQVAPQTDDLLGMIAKLRDQISFLGAGRALNRGVDAVVSGVAGLPDALMAMPEELGRSAGRAAVAPGQALSSSQPVTSEQMIPPAMDIAGLAGGGALTEKPGVATLGSGPIRKAAVTEPAPVFYSALEHAATNAVQDTMSPQQWLGYLKNQPGVKAEEMQWTGLGDWLGQQKGKVSKKDVQSYLDEHKTEIKDVTKGDDLEAAIREHIDNYWAEEGREPTLAEREAKNREIAEDIRANPDEYELGADMGTQYSDYQLPGGENYREHLLTLPSRLNIPNTLEKWVQEVYKKDLTSYPPDVQQQLKRMFEEGQQEGDVLKNLADYRSSHWDEPNVLAHVRTNDRVFPGEILPSTGKPRTLDDVITARDARAQELDNDPRRMFADDKYNKLEDDWRALAKKDMAGDKTATLPANNEPRPVKSLHIEEIQSDWHQQGRKSGYGPIDNPETWTRVPDAPFKTTWPELALKRMIRHAADNGYDRISWTPGEAQAARYDLSKQIDRVVFRKTGDSGFTRPEDVESSTGGQLVAYDKSGKKVIDQYVDHPDKLPDYIGKEAAQKLVDQKPTEMKHAGLSANERKLENADLKVGGEGMREFYDKMLPKMAEKIGKAHGVKVKQTQIGNQAEVRNATGKAIKEFATEQEAKDWLQHNIKGAGMEGATVKVAGQSVHYFDLPQSLKDHAVGRGFPLYMSGVPFPLTPVDHDPFAKKERK